MVKYFLRNIISIVLALLVLFSTLSFTVVKHYCMDSVVEVSFTGKTQGCSMTTENDNCKDVSKQSFKDSCCKDTLEVIKNTNDELKSGSEISSKTIDFFTAFIISKSILFNQYDVFSVLYLEYISPPLIQNFTILFDVFLI